MATGDETGRAPALSRVAVGSVVWQGLSFFLGRGLNFATTVVLARLLTPEDFGVVGLAIVFITFAQAVSDLGVAQALVYFPPDRRDRDAAVVLSVGSGVLLCAAGVVAAPAIAGFFHEPGVTPMVRVLSATLLLAAVRQVPDALMRRELAFRRRVITQIVQSLAQGLLSIALAVGGAGAWAIVWGYVGGTLAACVVTWALVSYRPELAGLRIEWGVTRRLLGYGGPAAIQGLLAALIFDVDYVVVGTVLGAEALGVYTLAFRLPQLLIVNVFGVLASVAFPMYSRVSGDRQRLRRGYARSLRLQMAYGAAAGVGLFMVAPLVVPVVLGARWEDSVGPLEGLALYATARSLGAGAVEIYKSIGRPEIGARVAAVRLAILIPVLILVVHGGIEAVAWTQAGLALVFAVGMQAVAMRVLGMRPADLVGALRPAAALAAGAALGSGVVRLALPGTGLVQLCAAIAAGAAAAAIALALVDAPFLRELRALVGLERRASAVPAT